MRMDRLFTCPTFILIIEHDGRAREALFLSLSTDNEERYVMREFDKELLRIQNETPGPSVQFQWRTGFF